MIVIIVSSITFLVVFSFIILLCAIVGGTASDTQTDGE